MVEITKEVKRTIEENPVALSTVDKENSPNVIAVAYVKVVSDNQILITDNYMKQTKENLENNDKVCLVVWNKDLNGYKLIGTAEYFSEGEWKKFVEEIPENKCLPAKGAILITLSKIVRSA